VYHCAGTDNRLKSIQIVQIHGIHVGESSSVCKTDVTNELTASPKKMDRQLVYPHLVIMLGKGIE
jgi:hypothetical protein